jgi:hypothetical protein
MPFELVLADHWLDDPAYVNQKTGTRFCKSYRNLHVDVPILVFSAGKALIKNIDDAVAVFGYESWDELAEEILKFVIRAKELKDKNSPKNNLPVEKMESEIYKAINEHKIECQKEVELKGDQRYIRRWSLFTGGVTFAGVLITLVGGGWIIDLVKQAAVDNAIQNERIQNVQQDVDTLKNMSSKISGTMARIQNRYIDTIQ